MQEKTFNPYEKFALSYDEKMIGKRVFVFKNNNMDFDDAHDIKNGDELKFPIPITTGIIEELDYEETLSNHTMYKAYYIVHGRNGKNYYTNFENYGSSYYIELVSNYIKKCQEKIEKISSRYEDEIRHLEKMKEKDVNSIKEHIKTIRELFEKEDNS